MHADLRELADLAERVRQHPRYHALTREVDTPDHPAARLAAWLDAQSYTETKRALRDCLDWMDGDDDLRAALREYDGDADALAEDLDSIRDRLKGSDE